MDIMTVDDMEDNLEPSSNPNDVSNVIPKEGVPDVWTPSSGEKEPSIRVRLPEVNGVPPEEYELMKIEIKAFHFELVTVTVTDSDEKVVFNVRYLLYICLSYLTGEL